jgi:hypothetical protein
MLYMSTFCSFYLLDEDTFFKYQIKEVYPMILTGQNLLRAQLTIAARVGGSANVAQVICFFFTKMRYVVTSGTPIDEG